MKHIKNFENFSLLENKQERTIKTYTDSSDSIDFNLYSVKDETDSIKYLGEVWFDGIKYDGYIEFVKSTGQPIHNFTDSEGNEFDPTEYDLHYQFDDLIQNVIDDEIKEQI